MPFFIFRMIAFLRESLRRIEKLVKFCSDSIINGVDHANVCGWSFGQELNIQCFSCKLEISLIWCSRWI